MSWPIVPLGELAEIRGGGTPDKKNPDFWGGSIPWASVKDFKGSRISRTVDSITQLGVERSATRIVACGSILVPTRMAVGKVAIAERDLAINQDLKALTPNEKVDRDYLFRAIEAFGPRLEREATGATVKGIKLDTLRSLTIPLPPLDEQKRIAAILDKADALRQARRRAITRLDDLAQSIFYEMFGEELLRHDTAGSSVPLGDLADIGSGITKGRKIRTNELYDTPYLAVANVQERYLKLDVVKSIQASQIERKKYKLRVGDLLLTEGGDPDKLGRGAIWDGSIEDCIHQNHVFRVRFDDSLIQPIYAMWLIGSDYGKRYFLRSAKQTTGIASINKTQLSAFPMLVPSLERQTDFAKRIGAVKRLSASSNASWSQLENLFGSLQTRAFEGEL